MSKIRSAYVCENALYEYSKVINLSKFIKVGNGITKPNKSVIADVFEAVIGVIYLEFGFDAVKEFFNKLIHIFAFFSQKLHKSIVSYKNNRILY